MTNTTKLLVAALVAAVGCGSGAKNAPEPKPEPRAEVQSPTEVASYEARESEKVDPVKQGKLMLEEGKVDEAIAHFQQLTAAEPDNAKAWQVYGYAVHMSGDLDKALEIHEKAATFEKVAPVALYNVACVHALKGDVDAAFAALDRAATAGFDMAEHLDKDEDLANLREDARFPAFVKAVEANAAEHKAMKKHEAKGDGAGCDADHGHGHGSI